MKTTLEKLQSPTPRKNKIRGQIVTGIGTACMIAWSLGVSSNSYINTALIIVAVLSGVMAFKDGKATYK